MSKYKMNEVEEVLWKRVDARKRENQALKHSLNQMTNQIHSLQVELKCVSAKVDACPDDIMPEIFQKKLDFVVNERLARTGAGWTPAEENYVYTRFSETVRKALSNIGTEVGRTGNAIRCRLRQEGYSIEF